MTYGADGWGCHSELGAGVSGREVWAHKSDEGMRGHLCRVFNECDWWVLNTNMRKGLPMRAQDIVSKHETLEGAKAALLVMLAL